MKGALSLMLYAMDLVLISETIRVFGNNFTKLIEDFESKSLMLLLLARLFNRQDVVFDE